MSLSSVPSASMKDQQMLSLVPSASLASPETLQTLAMDVMCRDLLDICAPVTAGSTDTPYPDVYPPCFTVLRFPAREVFFHAGLAEKLLQELGRRKKLTDQVMTLFDSRSTHLKSVRLTNCSNLTSAGLRTLRGHKLVDVEAVGLSKATVTDLIGCLGEWSVRNLRTLSVSQSTFVDASKHAIMVSLSKLRCLHTLNVSWTEFNKASLEMVVEDLPQLESVDISCTKVSDVSCLRKCRSRLKSLSMYGVRLSNGESLLEVLAQLTELRHLDVSEDNGSANAGYPPSLMSSDGLGKFEVKEFLSRPNMLPNLISLDLSGHDCLCVSGLKSFLNSHPGLQFLGLVLTQACNDETILEATTAIDVSGCGSERQVVEALRRYDNRPQYTQNSLYNLFKFTQPIIGPREDLIMLVVSAAETYPTVFSIQMAATACLYNLSRTETGEKLHPSILRRIVEVDLNAMEEFPQHQQLQKNALLTICSDRILQDVSFDRFRCAKLVMDCLYTWQNHSMNRMSVAICSILAAKISTRETSELGSSSNYMQKLLRIVRRRTEDKSIDVTLKFTLSALWNLTDESPTTCSVFLEEGGLELYIEVLNVFPGETAVETKVLGLLNNIAEVQKLRGHLMIDDLVSQLSKLLRSKHIDVCYFAAGIVAHLSSESSDLWTVKCISKTTLMEDLSATVLSWKTPKEEMVAYRSFRPFLPLLEPGQEYAVQLWAIWAILQVCSKNPKRYCPMLRESVCQMIMSLLTNGSTHDTVKELCRGVAGIMRENGFLAEHELALLDSGWVLVNYPQNALESE